MVRSFLATARAHLHNMTVNFGRTCMPWGPRRSLFAGGTGALFVVPGLVMFAHDPGAPHAAAYLAAFAAQAVFSVMSDYVMTGRNSVWHGVDRWFASGMTVFMMWFAHSALSPAHVFLAAPPLFCLYKSKDAILRNDFPAFANWHGWWHVTAVAAASHCVDLANGGGGLVARAVGRVEL